MSKIQSINISYFLLLSLKKKKNLRVLQVIVERLKKLLHVLSVFSTIGSPVDFCEQNTAFTRKSQFLPFEERF